MTIRPTSSRTRARRAGELGRRGAATLSLARLGGDRDGVPAGLLECWSAGVAGCMNSRSRSVTRTFDACLLFLPPTSTTRPRPELCTMPHGSHEEVIDLPVVRYEVVDPDALIPPLVDDRPAQHYGFNAGAEWEYAQGGEGDSNARYLRWLRKSPLLPGAVARRWCDSARAAGHRARSGASAGWAVVPDTGPRKQLQGRSSLERPGQLRARRADDAVVCESPPAQQTKPTAALACARRGASMQAV